MFPDQRGAIASGTLLLLALVHASAAARADDSTPPGDPATTAVPAPAPAVTWSPAWPRFRLPEYIGTGLLEAGSYYLRNYRRPPDQPLWVGDNVFDDAVRGWLRARTPGGRARAADISNWLSLVGMIAPFAVDLPVALLVHRQPAVTWQLLMMDLEATATANFINNLLFYKVGRARPDAPDCARDSTYDPNCGVGDNASFPSGHTVTIATAAGLTCVHHRYLPLYGHPAADRAACLVMSLATAAAGATRIMADRHFTSDVLLGAGLGFAAGYGLPWLLHYRPSTGAETGRPAAMTLVPLGGAHSLGLGLIGLL